MKYPQIFIERVFDIRRQEMSRVTLMSAYLLLIIACYTTAKAVRDSLFVTKIGPAQLPYMYLLIAVAMGLLSYVYSRAVNRIGLYRMIRVTSLIAISNLIAFWLLFRNDSTVWFYVLYVWTSLFGAITASQFWLLATHVFDPREARRVFAWVGVGGILGGIVGGGLTSLAARWFGTESLILICALMMALTIALLQRIVHYAQTRMSAEIVEPQSSAGEGDRSNSKLLRLVSKSRHLSMLVFLLSVAVIVEAFVDYEYKFVAKQFFPSKDHLTAFFGTITFYIGVFSLLFQMTLSSRILKRFGVGWAIVLLPAGLLAASVMLALRPVLWAAALLQIIDGGLSYSIHRSGMELLYLPIPPQTRNAVKSFIDMFVDRMGRAVGGLCLVLLTAVLAVSIRSLSAIVCGFLIVWIVMAIAVKREYLHSFRLALEKKTIEPEALHARTLDNASVRTLLEALAGDDEREILYALDLLGNTHPNRWRHRMERLIHHPSGVVRARTIALLAQWNDPSLSGDALINHPDYQTARIAGASALSLHWTGSPRDCKLLDQLLQDNFPEVVRQATRTAGMVRHEDAIPVLIRNLADRRLRRDTREALPKFGGRVIPELVRRLSSEDEPHAVRMRIPKALAFTGSQLAADALTERLHGLGYHLDFAVIKALNRIRVTFPLLFIDPPAVAAAIRREREACDSFGSILDSLEADPSDDPVFHLLDKAIRERLENRCERVFRLVALIYPPHDIYSVYYNCKAKPVLRPSAVEFLDNLLEGELQQTVVPLIEEVFDPKRSNRFRKRSNFIARETAIGMLIAGDDPWLKTIALALAARPRAELAGSGRRKIG